MVLRMVDFGKVFLIVQLSKKEEVDPLGGEL